MDGPMRPRSAFTDRKARLALFYGLDDRLGLLPGQRLLGTLEVRGDRPVQPVRALPWEKQSASPTVAEKAFAYGFEGVRVDGNDIFAVYAAVKAAAERARRGEGPTLIEGLTYRLGAHTTSDDPTRYRADEDVKRWRERDPVVRLERFLLDREILTSEDMRTIREECVTWARESFEEVENTVDPTLEDTFRYLYHEIPPILQEQMDRRKG